MTCAREDQQPICPCISTQRIALSRAAWDLRGRNRYSWTMAPRIFVCYMPGAELRNLNPENTPYVAQLFETYDRATMRSLPSSELVSTTLTGTYPHQHGIWQAKLRRNGRRGFWDRLADRLPEFLTVTAQCFIHQFTGACDVPTLSPRRRRQLEFTRLKFRGRATTEDLLARLDGSLVNMLGPGECVGVLGPEATGAEIDWDAAGCSTLHITGCPIEPTSEYDVRAVIGGSNASVAVMVPTAPMPLNGRFWGDVAGDNPGGTGWQPPQGTTNINDVFAILETFKGGQVVAPTAIMLHLTWADLQLGDINTVVNIADVQACILAFNQSIAGGVYPFGPADTDGCCDPGCHD